MPQGRGLIQIGMKLLVGISSVELVDFLNQLGTAAIQPLLGSVIQAGVVDLAADVLGAGVVDDLLDIGADFGVGGRVAR